MLGLGVGAKGGDGIRERFDAAGVHDMQDDGVQPVLVDDGIGVLGVVGGEITLRDEGSERFVDGLKVDGFVGAASGVEVVQSARISLRVTMIYVRPSCCARLICSRAHTRRAPS